RPLLLGHGSLLHNGKPRLPIAGANGAVRMPTCRWVAGIMDAPRGARGEAPHGLLGWVSRFKADRSSLRRMRALAVGALIFLSECSMHGAGVSRSPFGRLPDGRSVELFTLTNAHGIEVRAMTYGAIITSIRTPDRAGTPADIVLGFDSLSGYLSGSP